MTQRSIEGYSISPVQHRLWKLLQILGSGCSSSQVSVCIRGPLDISRLETQLRNIVSRHEALRTSLTQLPGVSIPVQTIGETESSLWLELGNAGAQQVTTDPSACWNVEEAPGVVFRARLLRDDDRTHWLEIQLPSASADVASLLILIDELRSAYEESTANDRGSSPDSPQYADVSEWLNQLIESEEWLGRQYWMRTLTEVKQQLPFYKAAKLNIEAHTVQLSPWTAQALSDLSRRSDSKVEALLLAAWAILLQKFGCEVPCIGVACNGRSSELLRNCIGPLTRHLPMRVPIEGSTAFAKASAKLADELAQAAEWQEFFDWERLGKELWNSAGVPYFPFSFEYVNAADCRSAGPVTFTIQHVHAPADLIGLHLNCTSYNDRMQLRIYRDRGLYAGNYIKSLCEGLSVLLDDAIARPTTPSAQLSAIGLEERKWLLEDANATTTVFSEQGVLLHELVSAQARKTPEAVALIWDNGELSYKEVDERAAQVAEYLAGVGIGPEELVAIWMERCPEMIIAMLGVLKAGGAYVPIDPQYPEERVKFMLRDSGAKALITSRELSAQAHGLSLEPLTVEKMYGAGLNRGVPRPYAMPDSPAYIIYTSGSTGAPKGVVISHRAITNHMNWMGQQFPLQPDDHVLQKTSFSFDASVWEFYAPLISGSRLVLLRPGGQQDREYMLKCIAENKITVLQLVPSQLRMLLESDGLEQCTSLRLMFCGGEDLPTDLVLRLRAKLPECQLYNLYGPTEATIDSTCGLCDIEANSHSAPIGKPVANTRVYVLDRQGGLCAPRVKGELYIGGAGLARGYLHRPDLTAERFVPDPFSRDGGERLYRTGDLVCYRDDKQLEFIGRLDHQVKLRGYRIELPEIEAELARHSGVQQAVAVIREDTPGDKRLVAYLSTVQGAEVDANSLHAQLKQNLPSYMLPSEIVILDRLPLTANGKVDRAALRALEPARVETLKKFPEGILEEILCGIFSEVLGRASVGVDENFFEIGGHSLLATQMVSRIRRALEVDLPLRDLFNAPTVRGLCASLKNAWRSGLKPPPLIQRADRQKETPTSHAQQRLWFVDQMEPGNPAYNMPFAIQFTGPLDVNAVVKAVKQIVQRHEILRTTFIARDGTPLQSVASFADVQLQEMDLAQLDPPKRDLEIRKEFAFQAQEPFSLQSGPLLRLKLLRLEEQVYVLAGCLHHIVCDGWSINLLAREFASLYQASKHAEEPLLPELPIQYADYALWQREWLQSGVLQEQLRYWRRQLADLPATTLPLDFSRPEIPNWAAESIRFSITEELTRKLKRLAHQESATLFMVFVACWQLVFSRYTGENDVAVGIAVSNRGQKELEHLIGCFVNTLVLRTPLRMERSFREILENVRHVTIEAQAHQDLPFEVLVEDLQPQREFNRTPLFQTMLVHQHAAALDMKSISLKAELIPVEARASKQDLTLYFIESGYGVAGEIVYRSALFKPSSIARLLRSLEELIAQVCRDPDCAIAGLQWSGAEESGLAASFADSLQ